MSFSEQKIDVAAYIWPSYTGNERRAHMFWREKIGEWQSVHRAEKKRADYEWPRRPLWGYVNEADPDVMSMEINAAVTHGVNVFIYDWYWYDHRPFLENCLDEGFLGAYNRDQMKFYVMWANHDATHLWNKDLSDTHVEDVIWGGTVDRHDFEIVVHRVIERYFSQPNYYCINGCPVFMIYDLRNLVKGLGSAKACRQALDYFREETVKAGFPGLHLQCVATGRTPAVLPPGVEDPRWGAVSRADFKSLGFDSLTNYQFYWWTREIEPDYLEMLKFMRREWDTLDAEYDNIYVPHVAIGWDNNPRFHDWRSPISTNSNPENFQKGLEMAKEYLLAHPEKPQLVTLNSWNEWTETSYLEPDTLFGYGYLDAVKRVFGK